MMGIDQAMMCGSLPPTEDEYAQVSSCRRILWEMSFGEGFSFRDQLKPISRMSVLHPNVEGVLLDDFSTTEMERGAKPEILSNMRRIMMRRLQLWIVVYSMSLEAPGLSEYLRNVDGIVLAVWQSRDLPHLREWVHRCNQLSGGKPVILVLYLYDFGDHRELTISQMEDQVSTGADLVREGQCQGLCFLASSILDVGLKAVDWTKGWIERAAKERI